MRPRPLSAVVIDLDDTLLSAYRRPDLAWRSVCLTMQAELGGLAPDVAAQALTRAGQAFWRDPTWHELGRADPRHARRLIATVAFETLLREGHPAPASETVSSLADAFSRRRDEEMRLEAGAEALLLDLRDAGYRLALLTNGAGPLQRAKIERFGLEPYFDHIQIEGEVGVGKPFPDAFRRAFAALAVEAPEVCVIGDSLEWDIRPAKALGCRTVLYDPERALEAEPRRSDADVVVRTLTGLARCLPALHTQRE